MKLHCISLFVFIVCVGSLADTIRITKPKDFADLVDNAASGSFSDDIVLETDLDFTDNELKKVVDKLPLGMKSDSQCTPYTGTFDGNHFHLMNLQLLDKARSGLFCEADGAVIKNLVIDDSCTFSGDIVGGVVVNATGDVTIDDVNVYGRIIVKGYVGGGMIGSVYGLADASITVKNSGMHGTVVAESFKDQYDYYYCGGLIGSVESCSTNSFLFTKNVNNVTLSNSFASLQNSYNPKNVGGFVGGMIHNSKIDITVTDNVNNAYLINAIVTDTDQNYVGGMFGYIWGSGVSLTIENNINKAEFHYSIGGTAYAGGFIGELYSDNNLTLAIKKNTNHGDMFLDTHKNGCYAGGYIGHASLKQMSDSVFESNTNDGRISVTAQYGEVHSGGIFGFLNCAYSRTLFVYNNTNNGDITVGNHTTSVFAVSGIAGRVYASSSANKYQIRFCNNTNNGNVNVLGSKDSYAVGGILGYTYFNGEAELYFDGNVNSGVIQIEDILESYGISYLGGIVGYFNAPRSSAVVYEDYIINNINKGDVQAKGMVNHYLAGIVGHFYDCSSRGVYINNNTNIGGLGTTFGKGNNVGGIVGYLSATGSGHDDTFMMIGNTNIGTISVISNVSTTIIVGGMVGYSVLSFSNDCVINENINNGNIHATSVHVFYIGGFFGFLGATNSEDEVHFERNINNGVIIVDSYNDNNNRMNIVKSLYFAFVSGLIGSFGTGTIYVVDCANFAGITCAIEDEDVKTCGLVYSESDSANVIIRNCYNGGAVEGANAYGVSRYVYTANNVVSAGVVTGTYNSYSFWIGATEVPTSIYGLSDKCMNCDGNVTLITKDSKDGKYHTVSGDKALVESLLNAEAEKKGYKLRWSHDLSLRKLITIHIGSPINKDLDVLSGTTIEEISVLKQYLESKEQAVGDLNSNKVLNGKSVVTEDMKIVVMERHAVAIDMEEGTVLGADVDATELAQSISALSGVDVNSILIDVEVDGNGYVLRVIVILSSDEFAEKVVSSINSLNKDGQCAYDILCHASKAYIIVDEQVISGSDHRSHPYIIFAMVMLMLMKMI